MLRFSTWLCVALCFSVLLSPCAIRASTVYVNRANGSDAAGGRSWAAAKCTVTAALGAALTGDEIWVAAGTYTECIVLKSGVALLGGFVGGETSKESRDPAANTTTLDGNKQGRVVTIASNAASSTIIDGFVIRNGSATQGAGIYCYSGSPTISNNTITRNFATSMNGECDGGGICCLSSNAVIRGNRITGNGADSQYTLGCGGGIYCSNGTPKITNNVISENYAASVYGDSAGGGIYQKYGSALIADNVILGNGAEQGGGVFADCSPTLANNTIVGNDGSEGAGIYCYDSFTGTIANNIISLNASGICSPKAKPTLKSNCVYNPGGTDYSGIGSGAGDISADPRLVDLSYLELHLATGSPCIDRGDDTIAKTGWLDVDGSDRIAGKHVDIGADEADGATWTANPRVIRVSKSGSDFNDGSSWGKAKLSIQSAIDAAAGCGEVWVAEGTYAEPVYLRIGVYVYGGFHGTESARDDRRSTEHVTVLEGGSLGSSIVTARAGYRLSAIDGFTIQHGYGTVLGQSSRFGGAILCFVSSPIISGNTITSSSVGYMGGGIYSHKCSPLISGNTIKTCSAQYGGGMLCHGGSPVIIGNVFSSNTAGTYGGGIDCYDHASAIILNNVMTDNSATGAAVYCDYSDGVISGNTISGSTRTTSGINLVESHASITANTISGYGSALYMAYGAPTVKNNTMTGISVVSLYEGIYCFESKACISGNRISGYGSSGIYCYGDDTTEPGTTVVSNNIVTVDRGGIYVAWMAHPDITNNTVVSNTGHGIWFDDTARANVSNNIVAFNNDGIVRTSSAGSCVLRNNCVHNPSGADYSGLSAGDGDICDDPLIVDKAAGDLHLTLGSRCIDAGWNSAPGLPTTDMDGQMRVWGANVDIGADEYGSALPSVPTSKSLLDGDWVFVPGLVVTAAFTDHFYVEPDDRSVGVRIEKSNHGLTMGSRVDVLGSMSTTAQGERCISALSISPNGTGSVQPVAMTNASLGGGPLLDPILGSVHQLGVDGGAGLNTIGLLVKTCGAVVAIDGATTPGWFTISDGSGAQVKAAVPVGVSINRAWKRVLVTGICSRENGARLLRVRTQSDIVALD